MHVSPDKGRNDGYSTTKRSCAVSRKHVKGRMGSFDDYMEVT